MIFGVTEAHQSDGYISVLLCILKTRSVNIYTYLPNVCCVLAEYDIILNTWPYSVFDITGFPPLRVDIYLYNVL